MTIAPSAAEANGPMFIPPPPVRSSVAPFETVTIYVTHGMCQPALSSIIRNSTNVCMPKAKSKLNPQIGVIQL